MKKDAIICLVNRYRDTVFPGIYLEKAEQALKKGRRGAAMLAFERILEIDPGNAQAKRLIRK